MERELSERPTYELFTSKPLARDASVARDLSRALGDVVADAWSKVDPDGALRVALITRTPATTRLVLDAAGKPSATLEANGFAIDTLTVSPDGARVTLTTASPDLFARYVDALSLSLRPAITLKRLHTLDAASLAGVRSTHTTQAVPNPRGSRAAGHEHGMQVPRCAAPRHLERRAAADAKPASRTLGAGFSFLACLARLSSA
jgi:hypothetical protein